MSDRVQVRLKFFDFEFYEGVHEIQDWLDKNLKLLFLTFGFFGG
jgi:hypothetical protein